MEPIQRKFLSLCHHLFLTHLDYNYDNVLKYVKLRPLIARRRYLLVLILTDVFNCLKYCPTLLENVDPCVPNRNFRVFSFFIVLALNFETVLPLDAHRRHMPSTDSDTNIFSGRSVSVNMNNKLLVHNFIKCLIS
jgi:hypothetical protein